MKAWTKTDFDRFKELVCPDHIYDECGDCDRSNEIILQCFDDLVEQL